MKNYALSLKNLIQRNDGKSEFQCIVDGLKMISYSIGVDIVEKKEA